MTSYCLKCKRLTCEHDKYKFKCKYCNPTNFYAERLRSRMGKIWDKEKFTKSKKSFELLGCNMDTFRAHVEQQFTEGMTWDNYGFGNDKWNFDHIVPLLYDDPDQKEIERRMHYTNIQPMWQKDNMIKSNRFIG